MLANVANPTHTIMSFDPSVWDRDDVLPSVTLCGGMGGVKKGSICKRDSKHIICALTVESVESVCQTHRLNKTLHKLTGNLVANLTANLIDNLTADTITLITLQN